MSSEHKAGIQLVEPFKVPAGIAQLAIRRVFLDTRNGFPETLLEEADTLRKTDPLSFNYITFATRWLSPDPSVHGPAIYIRSPYAQSAFTYTYALRRNAERFGGLRPATEGDIVNFITFSDGQTYVPTSEFVDYIVGMVRRKPQEVDMRTAMKDIEEMRTQFQQPNPNTSEAILNAQIEAFQQRESGFAVYWSMIEERARSGTEAMHLKLGFNDTDGLFRTIYGHTPVIDPFRIMFSKTHIVEKSRYYCPTIRRIGNPINIREGRDVRQ